MNTLKKIFLLMMMVAFSMGAIAENAEEQEQEQPQAQQFVEGKQYIRVSTDVLENDLVQELMKESEGKVQVIEFFSYGCSWCYKLDDPLGAWLENKKDEIAFQRVPVEFQPSWRTLSKAYYVAVDLQELPKIHHPLFKAIHSDEITSSSEDVLRAFFVAQGVSGEAFDQAFDSFSVNRKHKWANAISHAYKVTAVPTLFIQGQDGVYSTSVRLAGSQEAVLEVADYLIQKQQEAAKASANEMNAEQASSPALKKEAEKERSH